MTVLENVVFGPKVRGDADAREAKNAAQALLTKFGLADFADRYPDQLSGGMKKRVAIARAIVHQPKILLFDEPTSGLDPITTRVIDELILKLREELSVCAVVVTHDVQSAARIATETALLRDGKIIFNGTPAEMLECQHEYVRSFLS